MQHMIIMKESVDYENLDFLAHIYLDALHKTKNIPSWYASLIIIILDLFSCSLQFTDNIGIKFSAVRVGVNNKTICSDVVFM